MSLGKNLRDLLHGAAYGQYERELRRQAGELNDLFLLLCYMEVVGLPNPATLYLLDVYPYLLDPAEQYESLLGKRATRDLPVDVHLQNTDIA